MAEATTGNQNKNPNYVQIVGLAVVLAIMMWLFFKKGDPEHNLKLAIGYSLLFLLLLWGLAIFIDILRGTIDLSGILSEVGGGASMSRFQLLIFTFVIALSFFLIVVSTGGFPQIPTEVLTLLGISASTYAVSKGIQIGSQSPAGKHPTEIVEETHTTAEAQEIKQ